VLHPTFRNQYFVKLNRMRGFKILQVGKVLQLLSNSIVLKIIFAMLDNQIAQQVLFDYLTWP